MNQNSPGSTHYDVDIMRLSISVDEAIGRDLCDFAEVDLCLLLSQSFQKPWSGIVSNLDIANVVLSSTDHFQESVFDNQY